MEDWKKLGNAMLSGAQGETIRQLADTDAARKLRAKVDTGALEQALRDGDTRQMKALLGQALSGQEGQSLMQQLQQAMKQK